MFKAFGKLAWKIRPYLPRPIFRTAKRTARFPQSYVDARRRRSAPVLTAGVLQSQLSEAGVRQGDLLMVHSALSRIGNVKDGPYGVIEALFGAVGESGTIMMPSFISADDYLERLKKGDLLDLRTDPSGTGSITEAFRQWPGAKRSSHPFSSICVCGPNAQYIVSDHNAAATVCHDKSPLSRLMELDGKILGLGVTLGPVSFYHVLEDTWQDFPLNPYTDIFEARYIDTNGLLVERPVMRYNSRISNTRIDQPTSDVLRSWFTAHLENKRILQTFTFGSGSGWQMNAKQLYAELKNLALHGVTIYTTEPQRIASPGGI